MTKHILVIDGLRPVHKKLKARGAKLTLMIDSKKVKETDAKFYDRIIGVSVHATSEEWVNLAVAIHEIDPIHGIGAYHEMNQEKAALIAEKLVLPYHSIQTVESVRDKYKMRQRLLELAVEDTQCSIVDSAEEIRIFAEKCGYPIILKPLNGWASIGVSRICSEVEIAPATEWFHTHATGYQMYVEQFLEGEEYSVEAFSENGTHKVICVTKKYKDESHFVEIGHSLPTILKENVQKQIESYMIRLLDGLGVKWGATHTEIMLTKQGPRVIETHTRLGGDFIPDLIEVASGQDLMDLWARQTLGENVLDEIFTLPDGSHAAIWYTSPVAIGRLEEVRRLEEARVETGVSRVELFQFPGAELKGMHDSFSRAAYAIASGETSELAVENAKSATARLQFVVACEG